MTGWGDVEANLRGNWPPKPVHVLTCSGTWAPPGVGFASDAVQTAITWGANAVEVPVQAPWSFGPIGSGGQDLPTYRESVQIGLDWAVGWLNGHDDDFMIGGYSQGGECASRILMELRAGGRLAHRAGGFRGGYTFGNPCREMGHSFPGGKDPKERHAGISTVQLIDTPANWNDYADDKDMYSVTPLWERGYDELDGAGCIMREVYDACIDLGIGDFGHFCQQWLDVVQQLGENKDDPRWLEGNATIKDAIRAARIGIGFMATGTKPHIEYHIRDCGTGVSYVHHAAQHVLAICGT